LLNKFAFLRFFIKKKSRLIMRLVKPDFMFLSNFGIQNL